MQHRRLDLRSLPVYVHGAIAHTPGLRAAVRELAKALLEKQKTEAATSVVESVRTRRNYTAESARLVQTAGK
jgi:hypothetical protein